MIPPGLGWSNLPMPFATSRAGKALGKVVVDLM